MSSPADHQELFRKIYQGNYAAIAAYARRRVDHHDADDVLAETFLVAWRRLSDIPEGDRTLPWLYGVARRVIANQRRGERRRTALGERLVENFDPAGFEATVGPEDPTALAQAFAGLSESDRELLSLVAWEGLSRDEIAVALGTSRAAVRLRLHRARKRLRDALAPTQHRFSGGTEHEWT